MDILDRFRLLHPGWRDAVEILLVAGVLYRVLLLIHGTRAVQMLLGIVILVTGYLVAYALKFTMITTLLGAVFTYGVFAMLIVFQPELRAALSRLGQSRVTRLFRRMEEAEVADEIVEAAERLSRARVGAIMAIQGEVGLVDYVESGTAMQAKLSADLLVTIFMPHAPLHDGAVIIQGDTIIGARCILPLSQSQIDDRMLGTRHRAAIGVSEETDAIAIVVSEEAGAIAVAQKGRLTRNVTPEMLRELLTERLGPPALAPTVAGAEA